MSHFTLNLIAIQNASHMLLDLLLDMIINSIIIMQIIHYDYCVTDVLRLLITFIIMSVFIVI